MAHPAERRLARVVADAEWLTARLPKVLAALAATTPDGRGQGAGDGGRSPGAVADPTGEAVASGQRSRDQYALIDALSAELLGVMSLFVREVESVVDPGVDTEKEWSLHRCSGGEGEWADPTCTRLAVRLVEVARARKIPLCWACRKRLQRWQARADQQVSA